MEILWVLMFAGFIGIVPAIIARIKGQSFFAFWFFGTALFIVALPIAIITKPNPNARVGIFDSLIMVFAGIYAVFFIGLAAISLIIGINNQQARPQQNKVMAASKPERESEPKQDNSKDRRIFFSGGLNEDLPKKFPIKVELLGANSDVLKITSDSANLVMSEGILEGVSNSENLKNMKILGFTAVEISTPKLAKKIDLVSIKFPETKFGNGTFIVGEAIEPGTYKTEGGDYCYYERLRGFSGELGDILANQNAAGPAIVAIKKTDKGFSSSGCGEWVKIK